MVDHAALYAKMKHKEAVKAVIQMMVDQCARMQDGLKPLPPGVSAEAMYEVGEMLKEDLREVDRKNGKAKPPPARPRTPDGRVRPRRRPVTVQ